MSLPQRDDERTGWTHEADRYRVYPRADCAERFTVVAPNGCSLPLRPLWENEAAFLAKTLNAFAEDPA